MFKYVMKNATIYDLVETTWDSSTSPHYIGTYNGEKVMSHQFNAIVDDINPLYISRVNLVEGWVEFTSPLTPPPERTTRATLQEFYETMKCYGVETNNDCIIIRRKYFTNAKIQVYDPRMNRIIFETERLKDII